MHGQPASTDTRDNLFQTPRMQQQAMEQNDMEHCSQVITQRVELFGATHFFNLVAPFSRLFGATQSFLGVAPTYKYKLFGATQIFFI